MDSNGKIENVEKRAMPVENIVQDVKTDALLR